MKEYDEMTERVFRRIEEYNAQKQRKRKQLVRTLVPMLGVCLVSLIGVGLWKTDLLASKLDQGPLMNSEPVHTQAETVLSSAPGANDGSAAESQTPVLPVKPFLSLCTKGAGGNGKPEVIELNQTYETGIYLDFVSIKGMSEAEIEEAIVECEEKMQDMLSQYESIEHGSDYGVLVMREAGYLIARMTWNFFTLDLDLSQVSRIEIKNTAQYGQIDAFGVNYDPQVELFPHGQSIVIEKEKITEYMSFSWNYEGINYYMQEVQNPSCTDFNDTFYFTVEFDDGSVATATVDITFDESGRASVCCSSYDRGL